MKIIPRRISNLFRGPNGYIGAQGAQGEPGPKGDPGVVPVEYWEHRLDEMKKSNDRLRDRIDHLEQQLIGKGSL
jgi:hypothetical protein